MTVNKIDNVSFSSLSAVDGRTLSTLTAVDGQTISGGGNPPVTSNLIINWQASTITVPDGTSLTTGDWLDSSGTGNNPVNANPSNRPIYRATGGNGGRPAVEFNGLGAFALTNTITQSDFTWFAVLKVTESTIHPRTIISGDNGAFQYRIYQDKQNVLRANVTDYGSSTTSLSTSVFSSVNVTFNQTTRAWAFRLNGGADGTGTGGGSSPSTFDNNFGLNPADILDSEIFLGFLMGWVGYNAILSAGDITSVESWLTTKTGV